MSQNLVAWAVDLAGKAKVTELARQADEAAELLRGRIIHSEEDAAEVTDLVKKVKVGQKHVKDALDVVVGTLKQAMDAAREQLWPLQKALSGAEAEGKRALNAWQTTRENQRREAERQRDAARIAAEEEARRAAAIGVEVPPQVEDVPPPPPPTSTYGAVGQSYTTKRLRAEIVDPHALADYDPSLLKLDERMACDIFRIAEKREEVAETAHPHPSGGVVWHGIRFWREASVVVK